MNSDNEIKDDPPEPTQASMAAGIEAMGYAEPHTPDSDLKLFVALGRGQGLDGAERATGIKKHLLLNRFEDFKRAAGVSIATADFQHAAIIVLRRKAGR